MNELIRIEGLVQFPVEAGDVVELYYEAQDKTIWDPIKTGTKGYSCGNSNGLSHYRLHKPSPKPPKRGPTQSELDIAEFNRWLIDNNYSFNYVYQTIWLAAKRSERKTIWDRWTGPGLDPDFYNWFNARFGW